MPPKGKATDQARQQQQQHSYSPSSNKRKSLATNTDLSDSAPVADEAAVSKRAKPSIVDLVSSQGSTTADGSSELPKNYTSTNNNNIGSRAGMSAKTAIRGPSEMYQFTTRGQPNGVVDLTQTKHTAGISKPLGIRTLGPMGQGGPRRLVVKNLRTTPKVDPEEYFERKWKEQAAALDSIFAGGDVKVMLEELYKATEHICRQDRAHELFERLQEKCTIHLSATVQPKLVRQHQEQPGIPTLQAFQNAWNLWQKQLQTIRQLYSYLNQVYLKRRPEPGDINTVGMQLFVENIFREPLLKDDVLQAIVHILQLEREGDPTHNELLKSSIATIHELQVYTTELEPLLLRASKQWYKHWRQNEAERVDLPHYVRSCSSLMASELQRCDTYSLDRSTRVQFSEYFDEILVEENVPRLTDSDSILDMLEGDMKTELEQCWTLLSRRDHQTLLHDVWARFTETEATLIVFDEKNEVDMVVQLLALKRKLDTIHTDCFYKNETMGNALHKAFETAINKSKKSQSNWGTDNPKAGEMIAKHIDLLLKGGVKAVPKLIPKVEDAQGVENDVDFDDNEAAEESVEKHLSDALDLFRFVQGKDVFEAFYKKDFARRLLMGRTQSFDAERSMLSRLRKECGADFTRNLENMFKDMDLAREEMKSYSQFLTEKEIRPATEINVSVLSIAAWPTYPEVPITLPTSILKAQYDFEKHYKEKHVGRKLTWKPSLAHCQLKARFAKGVKELVVSGFQAVILLLFNDVAAGDSLSYMQIKEATSLPEADVKRTLQSLACAKYKVLTKNPKGRDVNDSDVFSFNDKFTDSRFRVKINQIQLKETKEENQETHKRVAEDRHYETQAAIVRIMKSRKRIGHNELIVEVIKATRSRGVLDQADIKKNIEKLIEKEYMEREEDIKGYSYLA